MIGLEKQLLGESVNGPGLAEYSPRQQKKLIFALDVMT